MSTKFMNTKQAFTCKQGPMISAAMWKTREGSGKLGIKKNVWYATGFGHFWINYSKVWQKQHR